MRLFALCQRLGHTKVEELQGTISIESNILGLEIAVHDVERMEVVNGRGQVTCYLDAIQEELGTTDFSSPGLGQTIKQVI